MNNVNNYKLISVPFLLIIVFSCDKYDLNHSNPLDPKSEDFKQADLAVSNVSFSPQTISVGANPTAISFRLTNNGPDSLVSPNTQVVGQFYVSLNSKFGDGDDIQIGINGYDFTLPPDSYIDINLSSKGLSYLIIPNGPSGDYHFFVHIEHGTTSNLKDSNQTNDYSMLEGIINIVNKK